MMSSGISLSDKVKEKGEILQKGRTARHNSALRHLIGPFSDSKSVHSWTRREKNIEREHSRGARGEQAVSRIM
ncbi:hypothetical protein BT93_K2193 [Corymbia citriodora subsp. variegata]|nr:hypothetical protein BT93_K2193 [Corymbia citriodora subsp. variegata]